MTGVSKSGGCLCGRTRYAYTGEFIWTSHCHCESCRRATSSPVTTFFAVPKPRFEFTGGKTAEYVSSPGVLRRFCKNCGSPVSFEYDEKPDEIHIYAMTLDESSALQVEAHDFWNERVAWLCLDNKTEKRDRNT